MVGAQKVVPPPYPAESRNHSSPAALKLSQKFLITGGGCLLGNPQKQKR